MRNNYDDYLKSLPVDDLWHRSNVLAGEQILSETNPNARCVTGERIPWEKNVLKTFFSHDQHTKIEIIEKEVIKQSASTENYDKATPRLSRKSLIARPNFGI